MNAPQVKELLKTVWKAPCKRPADSVKVLIVSEPGVGKSDIVDQCIEEIGADSMTRHLNIESEIDGKGMPWVYQSRENGRVKAEWVAYDDFEPLFSAKKPLVVHLEDVGTAKVPVQVTYMQWLQRGELTGRRISEHVRWVLTSNDTTHAAGVNGLIEPIKSRLHTIVKLDCDHAAWRAWAVGHGIHPAVDAFLRVSPQSLLNFKPTLKEMKASACPRTWTHLSDLLNLGVDHAEVIMGAIGQEEGIKFHKFLVTALKLPARADVIADPHLDLSKYTLGEKWCIASAVTRNITKKEFQAVAPLWEAMPQEISAVAIRDAFLADDTIVNTPEWAAWRDKHGDLILG